ncbi:MAG TPA: ABC transporter permease subunit [Conexibacter sp.]|nr:ABC transporter permease subunit [Conexibacter sp.]
MSRALSSELLKLRTTRTFYALVGSSLGLVLLIVGLAAALDDNWKGNTTPPSIDLLGIAFLCQLFALVLGILAVTSEFRHGTITPSLLVVPSRTRLISAKLVVHLGAGLLFGLATVVLILVLSSAIFSLRDIDNSVGGSELLKIGLGNAFSIALYAALGVGIGAVVRNQVGAIIGALAWIFVIESLLTIIPGFEDTITKYGLGGVAGGLSGSDEFTDGGELLAQVPAGLLLAAYVAIFVIAGTVLLKRRDISA